MSAFTVLRCDRQECPAATDEYAGGPRAVPPHGLDGRLDSRAAQGLLPDALSLAGRSTRVSIVQATPVVVHWQLA